MPSGPLASAAMAGYAGAERLAPPGDHGLEANWLAFVSDDGIGTILILAVDALFSSTAFENLLKAAAIAEGLQLDAVWVVASHTHFAPQIDPRKPGLGRASTIHMHDLATRIARDVADRRHMPGTPAARIAFGAALAPGSVYRRRAGLRILSRPPFLERTTITAPDTSKYIPRDMRVWTLEAPCGTALVAIVHWPCHPVASSPRGRPSPAHVGAIRKTLRRCRGATLPVLMLPGLSGDIRPDIRAPLLSRRTLAPHPFQRDFGPPGTAAVARFEAGVAKSVALAADPARGQEIGVLDKGRVDFTSPVSLLDGVHFEVSRVQLGPLNIIGMNAEPSHGWSAILGLRDDDPRCAATGYVGDVFGYLPIPNQIPEGGYEVDGFRTAFGFQSDWRKASDLAERVLAKIAGLP